MLNTIKSPVNILSIDFKYFLSSKTAFPMKTWERQKHLKDVVFEEWQSTDGPLYVTVLLSYIIGSKR